MMGHPKRNLYKNDWDGGSIRRAAHFKTNHKFVLPPSLNTFPVCVFHVCQHTFLIITNFHFVLALNIKTSLYYSTCEYETNKITHDYI